MYCIAGWYIKFMWKTTITSSHIVFIYINTTFAFKIKIINLLKCKSKIKVVIYSPSCISRPVWLTVYCGTHTHKNIEYWKRFIFLKSIVSKVPKNIYFWYSTEKRKSNRFGMTWVNDEIIDIFGWTIPFKGKILTKHIINVFTSILLQYHISAYCEGVG